MRRIQGALLPDTEVIWMEDGKPLDQASSYVWKAECAHTVGSALLWTKNSGITSNAAGFVVAWTDLDMGSLVAGARGRDREYLIEFTGTLGTKTRKHRIAVTIEPNIGA